MRKSFAFRSAIAGAAAVLAGCALAPAQSAPAASAPTHGTPAVRPSHHPARTALAARRTKWHAYPAAFVASASGAGTQGLAAFASSDGQLLRWLVRSKSLPEPVAVSPDGKWVYYYYRAARDPRCPVNGFAEPLLWRVHAAGGRPQRTDIHTTDLAFSRDGMMTAYTSTRQCGKTLEIVVHDRRTGATRRIIAAHNSLQGTGPVFSAELSWAPDDVHLAVGMEPDAALNYLAVINARRATDIRPVTIPRCAGAGKVQVGCLDPAFDRDGRLTFLRWQERSGGSGEWVVRRSGSHATELFRLSKALSFGADIAVDQTGNAILLEGHGPAEILRWSGGSLKLLRGPAAEPAASNVLWLAR